MASETDKPFAEHSRGPFYQMHLATGACASYMGDRVELSFFADRIKYNREGLEVAVPGSELLKPNGQIEASAMREHVTGVSLNFAQLSQLKVLIDGTLADLQSQSGQTDVTKSQVDGQAR